MRVRGRTDRVDARGRQARRGGARPGAHLAVWRAAAAAAVRRRARAARERDQPAGRQRLTPTSTIVAQPVQRDSDEPYGLGVHLVALAVFIVAGLYLKNWLLNGLAGPLFLVFAV